MAMAEEKAMYEGGGKLWSRPSKFGTCLLLTRTWPAIYSVQISNAPASDECGSTIGICGPRHEAVKASSPAACNCLFQTPVLCCLLVQYLFQRLVCVSLDTPSELGSTLLAGQDTMAPKNGIVLAYAFDMVVIITWYAYLMHKRENTSRVCCQLIGAHSNRHAYWQTAAEATPPCGPLASLYISTSKTSALMQISLKEKIT